MSKIGKKFQNILRLQDAYFFSTVVNIAGYAIRGTKEEWRILAALLEISGSKSDEGFTKDFNQSFGRRITLSITNGPGDNYLHEKTSRPVSSTLNNYYENGLLPRISPILSLCARTYVKKNDYQFLTFV